MRPDNVVPNLKPLVTCACGECGEGVPRRRAWVDGLHIRRCPCRRCVGSRQSGNARRREHKVARAAGGEREPMSGNLSGVDGKSGLWEWEETANVAHVAGLKRWWLSKQTQTKVARLMARTGSRRCFIASWDGRPQLVVVPFEDWANQAREDLAS